MSKLKILSTIILSLTAIACSKGGDKSSLQDSKIIDIANKYSMSCWDSNCNPSLAAIFNLNEVTVYEDYYGGTQEEVSYGVCTAWKAGEKDGKTLMATNRHCVENLIGKSDAECSSNLYVRFLEISGHESHNARCLKILTHSDINTDGDFKLMKDFAFFLLDSNNSRPSIPIKQVKTEHKMPVTIESLNFNNDEYYKSVTFKSQECSLIKDSVLNIYSQYDYGPVLYAYGCNVIGGNSGSVMLNNGSAIGVVYGGKANSGKSQKMSLNKTKKAESFEVGRVSFTSNFACSDVPYLGLKTNLNCVDVIDENLTESINRAAPVFIQKSILIHYDSIKEGAELWAKNNSKFIKWRKGPEKETENSDATSTIKIKLIPDCVVKPENKEEWLNDLQEYKNDYGDIVIDYQVPAWEMKISLDDYYRIENDIKSDNRNSTIKFNPAQLTENGLKISCLINNSIN